MNQAHRIPDSDVALPRWTSIPGLGRNHHPRLRLDLQPRRRDLHFRNCPRARRGELELAQAPAALGVAPWPALRVGPGTAVAVGVVCRAAPPLATGVGQTP